MNSFNPELYDDDIIMVEMESLGWRKGFKVTEEYSALNDESITSHLAFRMHTLLRLIEGESPNPLLVENAHLEDQVEELEDEVRSLSEALKKTNITIGKYARAIRTQIY